MEPIRRSEILPLGEYETIRPHFRARVIEEKRPRRVKLGDHMSAVFENRDSVLLQIQEMLRTERITAEAAIAHEIETYNELVPGAGELSLTLFVEIPEKEMRDQMLVDLAGLEDAVWIEIDDERFAFGGKRPEGYVPGRTTAVHYLKARLGVEAVERLRAGKARAAIAVTHPRYQARAPLGAQSVKKLVEDLASP